MKDKINIAIVGYGGMGGWHVDKLLKMEDVNINIKGIYDIKPERAQLAIEKGLYAYNSLEELLADKDVHLVTIATPNDVHKEIAVALMDAGKNVISEKPVAMNSAEVEEMIAASKKNNVLFTVHQNRRWDKDYLTIKKIFEENTMGKIFNFEHRVHGSRGIPGDWRNQKEHGGGMIFDWGIHLIDQMLMMMGDRKIVSIYAEATYVTNEAVDDGFKMFTRFDDGTTFLIEIGTNNFINLPLWYVLGENGSAVINDWNLSGEIVMVSDWENRDAVPIVAGAGLTKTMAPRTDDSIKSFPLPKVEGEWTAFYKNVFAALRGEEEQLITHDQIRRSMKVVEAVFKSAETNEVVKEII